MRVTYGHQVTSDDDIFMKIANDFTYMLHNSGPIGNTPVDFFPWLRHFPSWFPGTYYATLARSWYKKVRDMHINSGEDPDALPLEDIKGAGATIFSAGQETSFSTLKAFFFAMLHHPEIQQRAYDEITSLIGHNRLPDVSDRDSLPYMECILQENFRWHVAVPTGREAHFIVR